MTHVFVWTLGDVIALALAALFMTIAALLFAYMWVDTWLMKRRAAAAIGRASGDKHD
jgi:hypothetical protein